MSYCPNCGKHVNHDDNFCTNCGYDLVGKKSSFTYAYRHDGVEEEVEIVDTYYSKDDKRKSKIVAGLLQILITFGVGRFYLGYKDIGVIQLILSFFGVGIIWCFIDGIYILLDGVNKDASGVPLK